MGGARGVGVVLACCCLMSACAANDQDATRLQGAGVGAALGAGLGQLAGGDTKSTLVGLVVGGAVGMAVGNAVAERKADYASNEAMIDSETRLAARKADEMADYNGDLRAHIGELERDIAKLESDIARGQADHATIERVRSESMAGLAEAEQRLASVNQEIEVSRNLYQQAVAEQASRRDLAGWKRELRQLERKRDDLVVLIGNFEARSASLS